MSIVNHLLAWIYFSHISIAMQIHRTWTSKHWCESVEIPQWPLAYQKVEGQTLERKGRQVTSAQDMRHKCTVFGGESKCHICEDISCGVDLSQTCNYQIQGVDWNQLPKNIPTVTDVPWSVGGSHRYDFTGGSHVCLIVSGGNCSSPDHDDYSQCVARCWGVNSGELTTQLAAANHTASDLERGDADASDVWNYPFTTDEDSSSSPQGFVMTYAGSGTKGYLDGNYDSAMFANPQDVAVDPDRNVYVADTDNHCIRMIAADTRIVSTVAGTGQEGFADGPAAAATFSYPSGIAVLRQSNGINAIFVADRGNHRIRKIVDGVVSCFSGLCGNGIETATLAQSIAQPQPGLADGIPQVARFNSPTGLDVDSNGNVFVADTGNNVIRQLSSTGVTSILAGNSEEQEETPGCPPPCIRGVAGLRDGDLTFAQFLSPVDVAIGLENTLIVTDENSIRRVNYRDIPSTIQGIVSENRVFTLAGHADHGMVDGKSNEARMHAQRGVAMAADGRIYTSSPISCTIRRLSSAAQVARSVTCTTKLPEILRPDGCSSYNEPVDVFNLKRTSAAGNIYFNYASRIGSDTIRGDDFIGRGLKNCVGVPPIDRVLNSTKSIRMRSANDEALLDIIEDTAYGSTIKILCPSNCDDPSSNTVFGSDIYSERSGLCASAIHAGAIDSSGGLVEIFLERGINFRESIYASGTTRNGITSESLTDEVESARLYSTISYPLSEVELQTLSGSPAALLEDNCGFRDSKPASRAMFNAPMGIALRKDAVLGASDFLFVADSLNHRVRAMSAVCSKVCENGGVCSAADTCTCPTGWSGDDCTLPICSNGCDSTSICVAPDTCECSPGFIGNACDVPICSQNCANGGVCSAPDTCDCSFGWFDSNCTTPVCSQTCGNGGNCTAPNTCSCASEWQGEDCRIPVCQQTCLNGAHCIAPDTCLCPAGWSGHDCSIPICSQGEFLPDPSDHFAATNRPRYWDMYVPCELSKWCSATGGFDCAQTKRNFLSIGIDWGPQARAITGRSTQPKTCAFIEVDQDAITYFQYYTEKNDTTSYNRYSPVTGYNWNASNMPWRGHLDDEVGFTEPWTFNIDRQVALTEKRRVTQGAYVCANNGNCTAPDVCSCAPGWAGFDCRTPICSQGYFTDSQLSFLAAEPPESVHPSSPTTNPEVSVTVEEIGAVSTTREIQVIPQGTRYLGVDGKPQGGYSCSIRSLTKWEKPETSGPFGSPAFTQDHPNYYSRYMNSHESSDGYTYTHWQDMYWPPIHSLSEPKLDNTRNGWERRGVWEKVSGVQWQKGKCLLEFRRICSEDPSKAYDLKSDETGVLVTDTDASYRARVTYTDAAASSSGRWFAAGGECVDHVVRGCYNNGTCVAPDTCDCASGWSGNDCSIPICTQSCENNGNCTLPDICTCEKGWVGIDCSIPICAQECRNGGKCVAPDVCECQTWPSVWRDGREGGGRPVFRQANGDPQVTGYTGYDCSVPICTQAEKFVLNVPRDSLGFVSLRGHGVSGEAECDAERCPVYDQEVIANDGRSFQAGCRDGNLVPTSMSSFTRKEQLDNLRMDRDDLNLNRSSDELCGVLSWEQGDYTVGRHQRVNYVDYTKVSQEIWVEGDASAGEGVYQCYNKGSCIAPDVCTCGDGFEGFDCNRPTCRFRLDSGEVVGCQNNAVCTEKDTCECIQTPSILNSKFPLAPKGLTGWTGTECSIAMCVQGFFDPSCNDTTSGPEGCYRCPNNGKCVAPDQCECADGWEGYNCMTPVCRQVVTPEIRDQLFTIDEEKIRAFELDPCGMNGGRWGKEMYNGAMLGQGNCTRPNLCTCLCMQRYDEKTCDETGELCDKPWEDPLNRDLPPGYTYGSKKCFSGFEGIQNEEGLFVSCHLQIYEPMLYERYSVSFLTFLSIGSVTLFFFWQSTRKKRKMKALIKKAEKLKAKRKAIKKEVAKEGNVVYD